MKAKKIYLLIISLVVLALDISLIFILNACHVKCVSPVVYGISKGFAVIALTCIVALGLCKKDLANYVLQYVITIIFQFVPLVTRFLSLTFSTIILCVSLILYLCLEFGLIHLNQKSLKALEKLKGREIEIKELDTNGQNGTNE